MNKNLLYRSIPKVDILLADEGIKVLIETYSRESVMEAIHSEMEKLRAYIGTCDDEEKAKQPALKLVDDTHQPSESTEKELKVKVAPGAFDSVFEHETENAREWDAIYAKLANKSNLKIGKMVFSEQEKSFMDQ